MSNINLSNLAYLLLCGCAVGPHFGRNQTIVLEGHVDNLGISNEYTIQSKLYEIVDTSLRINIPYPNTAEYDIWMTEERPSHPCKIIRILSILPSKIFKVYLAIIALRIVTIFIVQKTITIIFVKYYTPSLIFLQTYSKFLQHSIL